MGKLLLKCVKCQNYTFKTINEDLEDTKKMCPICGEPLKTPHPPKFSMDNKYRSYLRLLKKESAK